MGDCNFERFVGHAHGQMKKEFEFDPGKTAEVSHTGFRIVQRKFTDDPVGVFRILVTHAESNFSMEIYPSKGFCVGKTILSGKPLFWDFPRTSLPDPESIDWNEKILIQGQKKEGFTVVKTLMGGVELYGLQNWGMLRLGSDGKIAPLHGELSVIPAENVEVKISNEGFEIKGTITYYDGKGEITDSWYNKGTPLYKVEKNTFFSLREPSKLYFLDQITNISQQVLTPDWGYHVMLRPEEGCRYLIPARKIQNRDSGQEIVNDFDVWKPEKSVKTRNERGTIYKKTLIGSGILGGKDGIKTLLKYPKNTGISFAIPTTPYLQDWFSAGGGAESEDMLIEKFYLKDALNKKTPKFISIYEKPWNAVGPEFGSSALDHDDNIDSDVEIKKQLKPGERLEIGMMAHVLDSKQTITLEKEIEDFNKSRFELILEKG